MAILHAAELASWSTYGPFHARATRPSGNREHAAVAGEIIDAGELGIGGAGGVAIIADERADDGADMGAVVLLIGAAARDGDALALAPDIPVVGVRCMAA